MSTNVRLKKLAETLPIGASPMVTKKEEWGGKGLRPTNDVGPPVGEACSLVFLVGA